MKVKNGFVSNSSSTSYILHASAVGSIPAYDLPIGELIGRKYPTCVRYEVANENGEDCGQAKFLVTLHEGEGNDLQKTIFITIEGNSYPEACADSMGAVREIKKILGDILSHLPNKDRLTTTLSYSQIPRAWGDGFDGGDPMGHYSESLDMFNHECKIGYIKIKNGIISEDLNSLQELKGNQNERPDSDS